MPYEGLSELENKTLDRLEKQIKLQRILDRVKSIGARGLVSLGLAHYGDYALFPYENVEGQPDDLK